MMAENDGDRRRDEGRNVWLNEDFRRIAEARLPEWDEIPNLELYMDQVISYVTEMLQAFMPAGDGKIVTASMVNNYVKKGVMPSPVKKRYKRTHVAYLFMILIAKSELQLREISLLLELVREDLRAQDAAAVQDPKKDTERLCRVFLTVYSRARLVVFSGKNESHTDYEHADDIASVRALYWICLTGCARTRSVLQVQDLAADFNKDRK